MRTTIDAAGRVVIPKRLRDRLGLAGGRKKGGRVAVPRRPLAPLTDDVVRAVLEKTRR